MDRDQDDDLQIVRRAYAKQVLWAANVRSNSMHEFRGCGSTDLLAGVLRTTERQWLAAED